MPTPSLLPALGIPGKPPSTPKLAEKSAGAAPGQGRQSPADALLPKGSTPQATFKDQQGQEAPPGLGSQDNQRRVAPPGPGSQDSALARSRQSLDSSQKSGRLQSKLVYLCKSLSNAQGCSPGLSKTDKAQARFGGDLGLVLAECCRSDSLLKNIGSAGEK